MTTVQYSSLIDAEFIKTCAHSTFRVVKMLSPGLISNYIVTDGNFPVVSEAFSHVKTIVDRKAIVDFLQSIEKAVRSSNEEHMKHLILDSIHDADPSLFFAFCRKPLLSGEMPGQILKCLRQTLYRSVPNRKSTVNQVSSYIVRRLMGDRTARTPLLWGPPGTGKSELATQLAKALTASGVEAIAIFQGMTQETAPQMHNEGGIRLLGTSRHFSNGTPGDLYNQVSKPNVNLGLVLLDEADKTQQRDYLIGLLDPKTPLQDHYVREVVPSVDLRRKALMLLTANDPTRLNYGEADPLWSRLDPVFLPAYTQKEMIGLAVEVICGDPENPFQPTRKLVRKLAGETLQQLEGKASFRAVLDQVNGRIFYSTFGLDCPEDFCVSKERKPIGFRI